MKLAVNITSWIEAQAGISKARRLLMAFAFGFSAALAYPPTGLFPVLAFSFPALIVLLRLTPDIRSAFVTGWCFAFGYFLLGLYWVAAALFVDIRTFWWALPLAVAGLPAVCAFYYGAASAMAKKIGLAGLSGIICFALCWFAADYARGHMLTGFPWNLEGYVWSDVLPIMQIVSVIGSYGLSLLTIIAACLPVVLLDQHPRAKMLLALTSMAVLVCGLWGEARLMLTHAPISSARVRVVQPNIEQSQKWGDVNREGHFQKLLDLSVEQAAVTPSLIVWPETASTFYLTEDTNHRREIASKLPAGTYLLTGVIRRFLDDQGRMQYANSLVAVDRSGRIAESYDKFHLVPFGEYIPLRRVFSLRTLANLGVDFTAGEGLRTLHLEGVPAFSPLICYEAIFPGEVARREDRPQFLVNVTNDGWYGKTAGPYQHYAIARTRAIEEGLPLIRSANTGVSGVIDAYGRITAQIDLGKAGFVDAVIPDALSPTIYDQYGDYSLWAIFGIFTALGLIVHGRRNCR